MKFPEQVTSRSGRVYLAVTDGRNEEYLEIAVSE